MSESGNPPPPGSRAYQRGPHDESVTPRDLKVQLKEQRLIVDWQDDKRSEFSLAKLRRVCPCASCRTEREQQDPNPLKILKSDPTGVRVVSAKLVGSYAIQFEWSDGHNTGIFDFRFLRALDDSELNRQDTKTPRRKNSGE